MRRVATVALLSLVLTASCVPSPPPLTPEQAAERDALRDKALAITVAIDRDQVRDCQALGLVYKHWGTGYKGDPFQRDTGLYDEWYLRYQAASLGADVVLQAFETKPQWITDAEEYLAYLLSHEYLPHQSESLERLTARLKHDGRWVLGEAFACGQKKPAE